MLKTLVITVSLLLLLVPAVKAQENRYKVDTGNDLLEALHACDDSRGLGPCAYARGFIDGTTMVFLHYDRPGNLGSGWLDVPDGVTYQQVWDVVRHFLENHPESRNKPSLDLIFGALVEAWPGPNVPKSISQGSGTKPTIDRETCAKIAAQPDPFAQFGGTSNDNAICREAYPDLYKKAAR